MTVLGFPSVSPCFQTVFERLREPMARPERREPALEGGLLAKPLADGVLAAMVTKELMTIGYEGMAVHAFTHALTAARVAVLADVRAIAHSRRPGFAKSALRVAMEEAGIRYLHIPALGNPKAGREAAWAGDLDTYARIYREHLDIPATRSALEQLLAVARVRRTCLMCLEADPADCHRSMVAEEIGRSSNLRIKHLRPTPEMGQRAA